MSKLQLEHITKTYTNGEAVTALRDVSLAFRENEFVSILGPSGCGKTTLLNIVGGLDRYDSGDLVIGGTSTTSFKAADWDAYRNRSVGFVFQNYNLIGHQTVLQNVEIALTISGISATERKRRARQALMEVGLGDQAKKKPNQLSGGQMQRVAIARALVNNPDIILADEPTGALDSRTSVQVMEILKEVARTRLVIMVTHNRKLAEDYSSRIITLFDGEIQSDSNPLAKPLAGLSADDDGPAKALDAAGVADVADADGRKKFQKTSMSLLTAAGLSFKNLVTKRGRTITTSFAGSIGIIGVALVLALSSGLSAYMSTMQTDMLAGFPIAISTQQQSFDPGGNNPFADSAGTYPAFPSDGTVHNYDSREERQEHTNVITDDYLAYIARAHDELAEEINTISYQYGVEMNLLAKTPDSVVKFEARAEGEGGMARMMASSSFWQEMPDDTDFVLSLYDLVGEDSRLPNERGEIALVVDEYNRIDTGLLSQLGLDEESYHIDDFIGLDLLKVIDNDDFYIQDGDRFAAARPTEYQGLYEGEGGVRLTIVGVLRIKEDAASSFFSEGLVYTSALTDYVLETSQNSKVAQAQKEGDKDVLTGAPLADEEAKKSRLQSIGGDATPTGINIYPVDFDAKDNIKAYLDDYNKGRPESEQVLYSDMAETVSNATATLLNTVSLVLVGFAAISLVVSTIMIGIITYVSVIERTKEIGILRSVGARKKDISRVFTTEAMIIGLAAGILGVALAYLLCLPINGLVLSLSTSGIGSIATLNPLHAAVLVVGSVLLTLIAGTFPARIAANKDPVEALRTD
ncbi:MAG: ATP-binding cassette domain-containing protein [Coriobacteriaceae bacterium]|jgi:putative ABC transport system permease protein|nr:ATP-binding cassette domain-containing protein [Coriobacteriaceae bacterium]